MCVITSSEQNCLLVKLPFFTIEVQHKLHIISGCSSSLPPIILTVLKNLLTREIAKVFGPDLRLPYQEANYGK